jgi:hypothetical protein
MSTIINVSKALGKDFVRLSGPDNYTQWYKAITEVAKINGFADIYDGIEPILDKPTRPNPPAQEGTPPPEPRHTRASSQAADDATATSTTYSTKYQD